MAGRRALVTGLKQAEKVKPELEKQFVFGEKAVANPPTAEESKEGKGPNSVGRAPLTTRVRSDFADALKRASLQRQLAKEFPNTVQDILEEALGPWLRTNGYIE